MVICPVLVLIVLMLGLMLVVFIRVVGGVYLSPGHVVSLGWVCVIGFSGIIVVPSVVGFGVWLSVFVLVVKGCLVSSIFFSLVVSCFVLRPAVLYGPSMVGEGGSIPLSVFSFIVSGRSIVPFLLLVRSFFLFWWLGSSLLFRWVGVLFGFPFLFVVVGV